jgi:MFS family permease
MKQRHILYLVSTLMDMSVAGVSFALSRRAAELHADAGQLGLLGGIWISAYSLLALLTGRASDRFGRRQVAVTGCVVMAIMALMCSFTTRIGWLLGFSAVFGAGMSCFWPAVIAWLGQGQTGPQLMARLTRFGIAWNVGLLTGFGLTGILFQHGPQLAFFFSSGLIVLIVVLLLLPARPDTGEAVSNEPVIPIPPGRGFRKTAWVANFAVNFAIAGAAALFPQLATSRHIPADTHGALLALSRAGALLTFAVLHFTMYWRTRLWPLWVAQLIGIAGMLLLGVAGGVWFFALAWFVAGAVSGFTYQASVLFTLEEVSEKGKGSGFHEAVVGAGMFLGPLLAGWVGNHHSLRAPYFFCAGILALLLASQMLLGFLGWKRTARTLTPP